jgi:hypothetical protein
VSYSTSKAASALARKRWENATEEDRAKSAENGKKGGRPAIPTPCALCGLHLPNARAARAHCRKPRRKRAD